MTDHTEAIGRELVALIRGTKDLHHGLIAVAGERVLEPPAFGMLASLAERGPIRLSALAEGLHLDVSTISRQVQDLEQAGWVVRERDPQDGRASLLRLSPEGEGVLDAARKQRGLALRRMLTDWTDEQRRSLAEELARLNSAMTAFRAATRDTRDHRQENAS